MRFAYVLLLLLTLNAHSQCKTFVLASNGDTLNCVDNKDRKQGKWTIQMPALRGNAGYEEEGTFVDGEKEGIWRKYSLMGDLLAIEEYKWGRKDGTSYYYTIAGLEREEGWKAVNPGNPFDTVMVQDVYNPEKWTKTLVKIDAKAVKHGWWKYYYPQSGEVIRSEKYYMGQLEDPNMFKPTYTKDSTGVKTDTNSTVKKPAPKKTVPKAVEDFNKTKGKKKVTIRNGGTGI
jgi:hypothetical protein